MNSNFESNLISIILPVRNEGKYIRSCLEHIFTQIDVPFPIEVIVSDGMSSDNTQHIVRDMQTFYHNLFLLENQKKIVPTGLNLALRQARGNIIIRVDGHCIIAPDYVCKCVDRLLHNDVDGVGGPMETIGETSISATIATAMSSIFGVGDSAFRTLNGKTMLVDTVPFPAYSREIIGRIGLYDEELVRNQDDEFNYRIRDAGGKLLLDADIRSKYFSRGSLKKLWSQYFQYGYWKVRVLQKHPRQTRLRQFVPPLFVLAMLFGIFLAMFMSKARAMVALVAGSYLVANFIASLLTSAKRGWKHLLLLPLCFTILHFSYGSGFLIGLIKFWNRWGDKKGKVPEFGLDHG